MSNSEEGKKGRKIEKKEGNVEKRERRRERNEKERKRGGGIGEERKGRDRRGNE